jgi:hypothetical protein
VLEEADFESIGREMTKGAGIDNSVTDGTTANSTKRKNNKGKHKKRGKKYSCRRVQCVTVIGIRGRY